jgi:hypothetical protein
MTKTQWKISHAWHRFLMGLVEIAEGLVLVATLGTIYAEWSGRFAANYLRWCAKKRKEDLR